MRKFTAVPGKGIVASKSICARTSVDLNSDEKRIREELALSYLSSDIEVSELSDYVLEMLDTAAKYVATTINRYKSEKKG